MFVELLLKKNGKILFFVFLLIFVVTTVFGVVFVVNNLNTNTLVFEKDGYALYLDKVKNVKAEVYSFNSGTEYKYKNANDTISFKSDNDNVKIENDTIIHYADNSLGVLKKVVGIDVSTINNNLIFYYNIYKNTKINYNNGYNIKLLNEEEITFKNLLMRISNSKFILTGFNIRLVYSGDNIVDFGDYVEFEYIDGNVVKIYNHEKYYQTISNDAVLLVDDIMINLKDAVISKENKPYISLTNLVVDNNGNIDTLEEPTETLEVADGEINLPGAGGTGGNSSISGSLSDDDANEEIIDESKTKKTPIFKVTELILSSLKIDARIEVTDEDALLSSDIEVKIVENSTSKTAYSETFTMGDTTLTISYADLKPDTEYTILATSNYRLNEVNYNKTFVSKIFRTDDLGATFEKNYATQNSLVLDVYKENYSKVTNFTLEIYDNENVLVDYRDVDFSRFEKQEIVFSGLISDSSYRVVMTNILCDGVIVDDGFSKTEILKTLKIKPEIGDLNYEIDKKKSVFNLSVASLIDTNYGIKGYRYEIYDARGDITNSEPVLILSEDNYSSVSVNIDEIKLFRGIPYTYIFVVEFYDNEKVVEYSKELGSTMTLDGVEFPTLRFDEENSYVTWEQIKGAIIVDDPSNAVVSSKYQVIYKNSIDVYTSTTITADTTTGYIPININGLRANETYTFQVYGTINMQDGNDTEENVYIGSVFVQTKTPSPLVAVIRATDDFSNVFSFSFQLDDPLNQDSSLEASTLSEITFSLYKGSSTDGVRQIYKRTLDNNDEPYESTLKEMFYDTSTVINPKFFDSKNGEYLEDTYTLEITNALDYTSYKNVIPIENNVFSFKLNSYIPELPEDENDAVIINTITNNTGPSFGIARDNRLSGSTTVGYGVLPKYYNETKTADSILWKVYVYNVNTGQYEHLENMDRLIDYPDNGNLEATIFEVSDGTSNDIHDVDTLRRGNEYYFTYIIYLDINDDGVIDAEYPKSINENVILRSRYLNPLKQPASISMYPSSSTASSFTWNYLVKDIDYALDSNNLYSYMDGNQNYTSAPTISIDTLDYNKVTFSGLSGNKNFVIKKKERLSKKREPVYETLNQQFFGTVYNSLDLDYNVHLSDNKLIINIPNFQEKLDIIDKVAVVDVVISPSNPSDLNRLGAKTISGLRLTSENIILDYFQISKYLGVSIDVELYVYFDSGIMGFDISSKYVAIQRVTTTADADYYVYDSSGNSIYHNSTIANCIYEKDFSIKNKKLLLTTLSGTNFSFPITVADSGIMYSGNNIILKELKKQKLISTNNRVKFDSIIPGISMIDNTGKLNITGLLNSAKVKANIIVDDSIRIQDNLIYVDLYKTDKSGTVSIYIDTVEKTVSSLSSEFELINLVPETNYYLQFYTYIYDSATGQFKKVYLYDMNDMLIGCKYYFYTLSSVKISNVFATLVENSYSNKKLKVTYNLDVTYGFDHIEYEVLKKVNGEYVPINTPVPPTSAFFKSMTLQVDASPLKNSGIEYGEEYRVTIKPVGYYSDDNGNQYSLDLGKVTYDFVIGESQQPYIGISSGKTSESIFFRVSISDTDCIIVDGIYDIQLVDSKGTIIAELNDQSISVINKKIEFKNTDYSFFDGETYTFIATAKTDVKNTNSNLQTRRVRKSIVYGDTVDLGAVTASKNVSDPLKIDIIFADSYKLSTIDNIKYTITSPSNDFYLSNTVEFTLRYDSAKSLYYYTLPAISSSSFIQNHMYTIGINFYFENNLITQTEVSYYYSS